MINLPKLILASGSPRRAEILTSVGWDFEKIIPDIDETELEKENPSDYVQRLAKTKAEAVSVNFLNRIVLGADTTVVIDNQIIGKPVDLDDARRMLRLLSGNWHEVLTGVAISQLISKNESQASSLLQTKVGIQRTKVKFAKLLPSEIEFLINLGAPLDKAGGYAVQAQAALFIEAIEGDYWNVVGLPISLVYELMKK